MLSTVRSEAETEHCAAALAKRVEPGDVLFLAGPLGMGKSVFARALIRTLASDPRLEVPSPTFTLVQTYDGPAAPLWHFDLYRIEAPEEIEELGWDEALAGGIVIVEWPSRLPPGLIPPDRLEIAFRPLPGDPDARNIIMTPYGRWENRQ